MSESNVEVVKALFVAWNGRNLQAAQKLIDPEIETDFTNLALGVGAPFDARRGFEGLQSMIAAWLETWESLEWFPQNFIDLGDNVIVLVRAAGYHRGSKNPIERKFAAVYTLRDGLVVRFRGFDSLAAAAQALDV
jgi:ketosteroid isomerase-like protein